MAQALKVCESRKKEIIKEWGDVKALDEEEKEDFEAEFGEPNMLMHVVMDTVALIMKQYKSLYEDQVVNTLGSYYYQKSCSWASEDEIHYATCFYAELLNNCSRKYVD